MTALSTLEAYDLLRHCATLTERIARAEVDQLSRAGLEDEKVWLHQALERVEPLLPIIETMLGRCRELPELAPAREDHAQVVQSAWVDALERLVGGLTLHAGSRAPILETLFPHLKFPPLRRASAEVVRSYALDLERRSRLGYVKRIFGGPDFSFVEPLMLAVLDRYEEWESCFAPGSLTEEEAVPLREALADLTARVERDMRQARLLAEASLCPVEGAFESSGIGSRPRRRVGTVDIETPPGMDPDPVDDGISLADALGWEGSGDADTEQTPSADDAPEAAATSKDADGDAGAAAPDADNETSEGTATKANGDEDAEAMAPNAADDNAEVAASAEHVDPDAEAVGSNEARGDTEAVQVPRDVAQADAAERAADTEEGSDGEGVTRAGASTQGTEAAVAGKALAQRKGTGRKAAKAVKAAPVAPDDTTPDEMAAPADAQTDTAPAVAPKPRGSRGGRRKGAAPGARAKPAGDEGPVADSAVTAAEVATSSGAPAAHPAEEAPTSDAADLPAQGQDGDAQAPATRKRSRRGRSPARAVTASTDD